MAFDSTSTFILSSLMQRKYSEPNTYIDNVSKGKEEQEELYDDVDVPEVKVVSIYSGCLWFFL